MNYADWFSNAVARDYLDSFPIRFRNAKTRQERRKIEEEAGAATVAYSIMVYKLYLIKPDFRKSIDSSPERRVNFAAMKSFLDSQNGEKIADACVDSIKSQAGL